MVVVYYIVVCLYLLHCMSYCIPALYAWKLWLNENHQSLLKPKLGPLNHNDPHHGEEKGDDNDDVVVDDDGDADADASDGDDDDDDTLSLIHI